MGLVEDFEKSQMTKDVPAISVGDTVIVHKVISEGKKQRIQKYEGIVISIQNSRSKKSITVRKIVDKIGVEKTFLIYSSLVPKIEVKKKGKPKRAKLYYLRERTGKKATYVNSAE